MSDLTRRGRIVSVKRRTLLFYPSVIESARKTSFWRGLYRAGEFGAMRTQLSLFSEIESVK